MDGKKICTIVGSDKGGVGKSMISLVMTLVFDNAGEPLSVVEIDNQRKLTTVLGQNRVDVSIAAAPDLAEIRRNRHAAEFLYNKVYVEWARRNSVTDLGANVTTSLMSWFRECDICELAAEDDIHFRFVACASPDEQAIKSAVSAIESASVLGPSAEHFVVLNDLSGSSGFSPFEQHPSYLDLLDLRRKGIVKIIEIPYCDSLLLDYGKARGLNPLQAVRHYEDIATDAGLDAVTARIHKKKMMKWLRDVQNALTPLLIVEQPAPHHGSEAAANIR